MPAGGELQGHSSGVFGVSAHTPGIRYPDTCGESPHNGEERSQVFVSRLKIPAGCTGITHVRGEQTADNHPLGDTHMLEQIREARKNESGFTLIELLIVIIILGVLAAVVVFAVSGITDRGKKSACKADVSTVDNASEAYYAKNGAYAATMQALVDGGFLHHVPTATVADNGYVVLYDNSNVGADNTVCPA